MTTEVEIANRAPAVAERMAVAARRFLATLDDQLRRAATFPFFGDERYKWNYRPMESMPRNGLWLIAMTVEEQQAALDLLDTGVSARGAEQTRRIMQREATLREHERLEQRVAPMVRDPQLYWWSVFGEPGRILTCNKEGPVCRRKCFTSAWTSAGASAAAASR